MREIRGVWPSNMPNSPASPGSETNFASPLKIDASALTTSTCMVAIGLPLQLLQRLGLLEGFIDGADHVERLFGQRVAFTIDDHLEATNDFFQRNVLARRAGKHFGHMEWLRQEALDLTSAGDSLHVFRGNLV